ncbi:MAG: aspartate aminotransferase family protein, partial [Candidatus Sericytochromatia bacterium]
TTKKFIDGINSIPELKVLGSPDMCVFSYTSESLSIFNVAEKMLKRGWGVDRQHYPDSLHMMVTPVHEKAVDKYLVDLKESVEEVKANPTQAEGMAAMYGAVAHMPDKSMITSFITNFLDSLTKAE